MNRQFIRHLCIFGILAWLGAGPGLFPAVAAREETSDVEKGVDVLSYGPIHEAFAETVAFDPEAGIVVSKAPPSAIDEVPPEQKPEGDVEWIPGYWAWDDDRNDFIWVSGIWRVVPPDRQWIPGYWVRSQEGFQWISGYWAPENQSDTAYLPEPPESVEVGPNVTAPSPDYTWIPGCWVWSHGRYAWRPGYWAVMRPDWVWMPAHYVWTPRGYIFVGGYWDFAVGHRGVLFAPVSFGIGVTVRPGFYFMPSFMIDLRVFSDCLFWSPRYRHYYFGDYYAPRYYQRGIFPWFSPHARRYGYDPIYAHQRWEHRRDPNWERSLHTTYQTRRKYEAARPPRTLYDPKKSHEKPMSSKESDRHFQAPFVPVTKGREGMPTFKPLSQNERVQIEHRRKEVRNLSSERLKLESPGLARPAAGTSTKTEPNKVKLPKSPIAAKPSATPARPSTGPAKPSAGAAKPSVRPAEPSADRAKPTGPAPPGMTPPERLKAPQTNPTVEPLQRKSYGVPATSDRIRTDKMTSPGQQSSPQPGPSVRQPQSRPSEGGERNIGERPDNRGKRP